MDANSERIFGTPLAVRVFIPKRKLWNWTRKEKAWSEWRKICPDANHIGRILFSKWIILLLKSEGLEPLSRGSTGDFNSSEVTLCVKDVEKAAQVIIEEMDEIGLGTETVSIGYFDLREGWRSIFPKRSQAFPRPHAEYKEPE